MKELRCKYKNETLFALHDQNKKYMKHEISYHASVLNMERLDPENHSSWLHLKRVLAWVNRFINNCRSIKELRQKGELQPCEIQEAENKLILNCQEKAFSKEIKALKNGKEISGQLQPLNPFIDESGMLRVNGRLAYSETVPYEMKYPIILPKSERVTTLIIKDAHEGNYHMGTNQTLAMISNKFWIISAREEIRRWEKQCNTCRRRNRNPMSQIMAPLPRCRTARSGRPFTIVSVDFAGPILTKTGRGKPRNKRYIAVFTCLEVRAVHLEMAYSLSTDSFLKALFRMTDRRGTMTDLYLDNGTNFVGAKNEIDEIAALNKNRLQEKTAHMAIKWHFNPPSGPHFGGVHEIMVKSAKRAVYSILNSAEINDEELVSALTGAENLINSRPLTYQTANSNDVIPLSPNHFLIGRMGGECAPDLTFDAHSTYNQRWRRVQGLITEVWIRWMKEFVPGLSARKRWHQEQKNFQVGDVVLLVSADTPRGSWPLGKIVQVFPGNDGKIRVVDVKVGNKTLRRPIVKLVLLQSSD